MSAKGDQMNVRSPDMGTGSRSTESNEQPSKIGSMDSSLEDVLAIRLRARLGKIYDAETVSRILPRLDELLSRYVGMIPLRPSGFSQLDALLITYADSILNEGEAPIRTLHHFLKDQVGKSISFVHLLPFFPSTSDDGFAVVDFRAIRPDLGTWDTIRSMAEDYRLVFDAVINHVSSESAYMRGFCCGDPTYGDYFISLDPSTDTASVLRTRNLPLLHAYETSKGTQWLWTTFSRDQVDLKFSNPDVLFEILDVLLGYAREGASMVRLDAIPYLWKELGTSCAHLPQTHELIKLIRDVYDAVAPHVLLLTETNVPHKENVSYFGDRGDEAQMIYNFSLAPLILWSLHKGHAGQLSEWARSIEFVSRNATYLNMTATHDGIGMRPTEGILSEEERGELLQLARDHGGDMTGKRNADGSVSPYELNLNYFDAVNDPRASEPEDLQIQRFLVSQAIPMAMMGIPGIYIHSLLGSRNDSAGVQATGRARSINREQLSFDRLQADLADPCTRQAKVFAAIKRLLDIRAGQSAFHPDADQDIADLGTGVFAVIRHSRTTGQRLLALHNVTDQPLELPSDGASIRSGSRDVLANEILDGPVVAMAPYQIRWILCLHEGPCEIPVIYEG